MPDYAEISDERLVEIIRSKNQELYRIIIRRYQDKLLRYVMYLTKIEEKADDIVQETFIKAFVNLNGFNTN